MRRLLHVTCPPGQFPVSIYATRRRPAGKYGHSGVDRYEVEYGAERKENLNYTEAAAEYGLCVMHALQCSGALD